MKPTPALSIHNLLQTQVQCVLSTVADDTPSQHLMAYAPEPSLTDIYIASRRTTGKVANMLCNSSVALLWDNRTGNTSDHVQGLALMAQAQARLLNGWCRARAEHMLLARNPELATLLSGYNVAVFALQIRSYRLVEGYDSASTFIPGGLSVAPSPETSIRNSFTGASTPASTWNDEDRPSAISK